MDTPRGETYYWVGIERRRAEPPEGLEPSEEDPDTGEIITVDSATLAADPDAYKNAKSRAVRYAALAIKKLLPRRKLAEMDFSRSALQEYDRL